MTLESIRTEIARIKELRRTDVDTAREQWKALRDRLNAYIKNNKLPEMWGKILLEELWKV